MERVDTFPIPRHKTNLLISIGNTIAIFSVLAVILQLFIENLPWHVYALELAFPALMLAYHTSRFGFFISWRKRHEEIASILGLEIEDYCEKVFANKEQRNYFEVMFLKGEGFNLDLKKEVGDGIVFGRTLLEAKTLAKEARKQLASTRRIVNIAGRVELRPEDADRIRSNLAEADFEGAYQAISDAGKRNEERRAEAEKILNKARKAHCLPVILQRFKDEEFDPKEAEMLILLSRRVRNQAKEYGIEKEVTVELENGDLEEAKSMIAAAKDKKCLEDCRKSVVSNLKRRIGELEGVPGQKILQEKLGELEELEYDTRSFRIARHDLEDQILRREISN